MSDWTAPDSTPTGAFTSTRWNTYIRDNLNHLHDLAVLSLTNTSGGTVAAGAVVVVDLSASLSFTTSTTAGDHRPKGVVLDSGGVAAAGLGQIMLLGRHQALLVTGAVKRGDPLQSSTTAGRAQVGRDGACATALTPNASGLGTVQALVGVVPEQDSVTPTTKTTASNVTYTAAEVLSRYILRDPNGAPRTDTLPTAALLVAAVQNPQVGDWREFRVRNTAGAANAVTLAAGAGGTSFTGNTLALNQGQTGLFAVRLTNVGSGTETYDLYSLMVGTH